MKTISIMYIEDDPVDVGLVTRVLKKADILFTHIIVSTKEEFINSLDEHTPDIILSDHSLPAFNSMEALKIVRNRGLNIPFILVTGNTSEEFAVSVMKAGADDYILKDRIQRLPIAIIKAIDKFELEKERQKLQKDKYANDKSAYEEINKIAMRLQLAVSSAGMGIWEWNIADNQLNWDEGMYRLYGIKAGEFGYIYDAWLKCVHPEDKPWVDESLRLAITGQRDYNTEFRIVRPDEAVRYIRATGIVERNDAGDVVKMVGVNWDTTRRKNDEEKIKESELRYRSLIEQATDAICIADSSLKFIDVNPIAAKMFGYTKEEILKLSITDLLFEDEIKINHLKIDDVKSGETVRNERKVKRKDGKELIMDVSTKMLNDGTFIIFGHDITQRKQSELKILTTSNALQQALNDLNKIMNSSLDIICTIDEGGKFVNVSNAAEKIWGYKPFELQGKAYMDMVFTGDNEKTVNAAQTVMNGIPVTSFENCYIHKDGNTVPMIWSANWDDTDKLMYCVGKDVTEKKELEILLNKVNSMARIGSWEVDLIKNTVYWSDITKEIYETEGDFVPDLPTLINFYKEGQNRDCITQKVQDAMEKGWSFDVELQIITPKGNEKWMRCLGETEFINGKYARLYGSFQDITERKLSGILLEELNLNLQRQTKMLATSNAELEQFAFVASHDLQEPLRMITSFLTLLQDKYESSIGDTGKKYIYFAVDGANRMRQIILDLLEFSRIGRVGYNKEIVDINKLVNQIQVLFQKEIEEKRATIIVDRLPTIHAVRSTIYQVFQNLVSNALKYCSNEISPQIDISVSESKDFWQFALSDNGIGIDKKYFETIFIIFQRLHTREKYSGTGIGLAITRKIIENLGGRIWVKSEEGKGSTFYFTLPKEQSS